MTQNRCEKSAFVVYFRTYFRALVSIFTAFEGTEVVVKQHRRIKTIPSIISVQNRQQSSPLMHALSEATPVALWLVLIRRRRLEVVVSSTRNSFEFDFMQRCHRLARRKRRRVPYCSRYLLRRTFGRLQRHHFRRRTFCRQIFRGAMHTSLSQCKICIRISSRDKR